MKHYLRRFAPIIFCRSPSWGAWIETNDSENNDIDVAVAPPRGERGLKPFDDVAWVRIPGVAPPRGERGLKLRALGITTIEEGVAPPRGERGLKLCCRRRSAWRKRSRSPSWGAWIETLFVCGGACFQKSRSPSWGAWIETRMPKATPCRALCRSPSWGAWIETYHVSAYRSKSIPSLPLVGSVD